jgi:hypothetical protein
LIFSSRGIKLSFLSSTMVSRLDEPIDRQQKTGPDRGVY